MRGGAALFIVCCGCAPAAPAPIVVIDAGSPVPTDRPTSASALRAPEADKARIEADVRAFSGNRPPLSPGWRDARERCRSRLTELGFEPIESKFKVADQGESSPTYENIVGIKRGSKRPSEEIIVSAHFDHIPGCPGADDDASGLAATLEIARNLGGETHERSLVVACWDLEEDGLVGSSYFANQARDQGADIKLAIALDAVGYTDHRPNSQQLPPGLSTLDPALVNQLERDGSRGTFIALIHDPDAAPFITAFQKEADAIGLKAGVLEVSSFERLILNDVLRADHASFWLAGYSGILLSDTGNFRNPGYHCWDAMDTPSTLDYGFIAKVTSATTAMVRAALQ